MNDDLPAPGPGPLPPSKGSRVPGAGPPPPPGWGPPPPPPTRNGAGTPLDLTTVVPTVNQASNQATTQQGPPTVFGGDDRTQPDHQPDHRLVIPAPSKGRGPLIVIGVLICLLLGGVLFVLLQRDTTTDDASDTTTTTVTIPSDGEVVVPVTDPTVVETTTIVTTTTPPATTTAPTTTVFVDPEVAAQQSLNARAAADSAAVGSLIDRWVPQVSTKTAGRTLEGTYYDWQLVWQDFQSSLSAHPEALLLPTDAYNYKLSGWWATVINITFATPEAANAWCDQQQYLPDHCFAKRLRYGDVRPGDVVYRK